MLAQADVFEFADVRVDTRAYRFTRGDREIALEPKAFAVLLEFISHAGEMLSRDALLDAVWGHRYVTPATLNRIIVLLRRALGDDPEAPHFIETVRGKGYRFVVPDVGGNREIAETDSALESARLLSIVGRNKTAIASEVAHAVRMKFADGICFFDLSNVLDSNSIVRAIATAFGVRASTETWPEQHLPALSQACCVMLLLGN